MSFLFPKSVKPPPVPKPPATPVVSSAAQDAALKQPSRTDGFGSTLLAGALEPQTGKKKLLG
jgi:hypothetical protein